MEEGGPGTVVLLAERGELGPAWVAGREGSRFVLQNLIGERFAVALPRLFWIGKKRLAGPEELEAYWQEVVALAARVDLVTAWHAGATSASTMAAHALSAEGAAAEDAIALAVFRDACHFRLKERRIVTETPEAVAETLRKRAEKEAAHRALERAETAVRERLAGGDRALHALDPEFRTALIDIAAKGRESPRFVFAEPLLKILKIPLGAPAGSVFELLVTLGELAPDFNLAPVRADLPIAFDAAIQAEAVRLAESAAAAGAAQTIAKDLSLTPVIAIDDPETTEIDDAVSLDPRDPERLHVLIADPALFVLPDSPIDRVARERVSTVYLPEGKVPMLPPALAERAISLVAGEPRTALDFSYRIEADGRIRELEVTRVRTRVTHGLSYELVDRLLAHSDGGAVAEVLAKVDALVARHRDGRHRRGAVTFQRPEIYWVREADGTVRKKVGDPLGPARQLIAELMVATCTAAAEYCIDRGIPCLFRGQAAPDEAPPPVDPRTGRIDDPVRQLELLRRLKPTTLGTRAEPHFTLGVSAYTQLTSPIRRYSDLLMHQQISAYLKTGRPLYTAKALDALVFELGRKSAAVKRVEHESRRFYALLWLAQNPGQTFVARVAKELGKKVVVEIEALGIQELVTLRRRRPLGETVTLKVISVDARKDALELRDV